MIRSLPIGEYGEHPYRIPRPPRDDVCDQELRLRQRQGWSVFFNRPCSRTRNANERNTSVI
jgi:hypothetical protein